MPGSAVPRYYAGKKERIIIPVTLGACFQIKQDIGASKEIRFIQELFQEGDIIDRAERSDNQRYSLKKLCWDYAYPQ